MSTVEELLENDPARTDITIDLRHETSDADLARALEQNQFVESIDLDLSDVQTTSWGDLLRVIAAREKLDNVGLCDSFDAEDRNAPAALISSFLQATQQNSAIPSVNLACLHLPTAISTFVGTASSITVFDLYCCDMEPSLEREQGARDLAAALQRNTTINTLRLGFMDDIYVIPILQSLQANVSLTSLTIGGESFSGATTRAMQQLLVSTTSIEHFHLREPIFSGDEFRPVISALSRLNSPLRSFHLQEARFGSTRLLNGQFQDLLRAVEKSKLERFVIGYIESHEQFRALVDSIPLMRVKELKVEFASDFDEENIKHVLLQAVKNNFSLQFIWGEHRERDIFEEDDEARLFFYADRNERLDQWVDNAETVDRKVWPDALKLAEKAGPDSLFRGLRSVLENDHTSSRSGRKRKRPQFYVP